MHTSTAPQEHALFDHVICPQQQRLRDGEPERLGGLEVDDELEGGGLLNWQVAGLGTL